MDRNENQNSYRNTRRERGNARAQEGLKRRVNVLMVLVILLIAAIAAILFFGKKNADDIKNLKKEVEKLQENYERLSDEEPEVSVTSVSETPEPTPTETPESTPTETPELTPTETPELTPTETPELTPTETSDLTPTETSTSDEQDSQPDLQATDSLTSIINNETTFGYKDVGAIFPIIDDGADEEDPEIKKTKEFVVTILQSELSRQHYLEPDEEDGKFGENTLQAVKKWFEDKRNDDELPDPFSVTIEIYNAIVPASHVQEYDISKFISNYEQWDEEQ